MNHLIHNYVSLLLCWFSFCFGQSAKLLIKEYRPFPEKISLLGIKPTQFNWSISNKFLLLDKNRDELLEIDQFGNLNLASGISMLNTVYGELTWVGIFPEGIRVIDRLENKIIFLDYLLNALYENSIDPKLYPDLGSSDPWGRIFLYSKTYNGVFIYENSYSNILPFIDFSKYDNTFNCFIDMASNQDGNLAMLSCDGTFYEYNQNGKRRMYFQVNLDNAEFLISLRDDWLIFNRDGIGLSINTGLSFSIPKSSIPILDAQSLNKDIAILTKDHILILNVQ